MDASPPAQAPVPPAGSPLSALWVEPEGEHRERGIAALRAAGWQVQVAGGAEPARVLLGQHTFDAAVIAERLPDGPGDSLLPLLNDTPSMVAVGMGERRLAARALRHGFARMLVRDADFDYLHSVHELLIGAVEAARAVRRRQHLLEAILAAQEAFIEGAEDAQPAYGILLRALLATTDSPCGFVAEVAADGALAVRAGSLPGDAACHGAAAAAVVAPGALHPRVAEALQHGQPVFGDGAQPLLVLPVRAAGRVAALVCVADRATPYTPDDAALLRPLVQTLGVLVRAAAAAGAQRETAALLVDRTALYEQTLDALTQCLSRVDAHDVLRYTNRACRALLDLPEELLRSQPPTSAIVAFQSARGDFGESFELVADGKEGYVEGQAFTPSTSMVARKLPPLYLRRTREGRLLEIRTTAVADGGYVRTFTDVTDYLRMQEALRESEARFRDLTALSSDWYWEQDEHLVITRMEGNVPEAVRPQSQALLGRPSHQAGYGLSDERWAAHSRDLAARKSFHNLELCADGGDGQRVWVSISGSPYYDQQGRFKGYRGTGRDITAQKAAEARIEQLAFYDELTGLPNRRLLMDRLARAIAVSTRSGCHGAVLFLDLDNFKVLNDTQGHEMGDRLLRQVARRLLASLRETDTVARLGGDEFVIVLEALHEAPPEAAAQAEAIGRQILAALNQPYHLEGGDHHSTPSIGITLFLDHAVSVEELLKRGDLAMYQAKEAGRNTLAFFDPGIQRVVSARSALEADLRLGLQRDELLVYYQPVVCERGGLLGVEALVRWAHPRRGMVSPADFIPVAEQTGLILPLGQHVLATACRQLVDWAGAPRTAQLTISVNVSAREFRHPDFVQRVVATVQGAGCNPALLKLELTESLLLQDVQDVIAKMNALKTLGLGFALDDFGTGYSSLSYLKRLPLDQLKIDQSFVRDVLVDPNDATIAATIVTLARNLGLDVVAEGVETEGQRDFLIANGCKRFQGWLFGRPAPVDALAAAIMRSLLN